MNKPARKSVRARWIVLTGQFNSSSNKNYVGTKFSCLKYDLQCTNFEPDKTYNTTMYVRPAKTRVSLCIDPLDKASFLHTVRSAKGLNRMCCCSRTVYSALNSPAIDGKLIDWLCWGLTTCQPLRVILCHLPEKGRKEIEERVEEMKERDREERGTGKKVKKLKKSKHSPLYPYPLQG